MPEYNIPPAKYSHATYIKNVIQKSAKQKNISFQYLLKLAQTESSLRFNAKAKTSTASGIFQFIEKTWINLVKQFGEKYEINIQNINQAEQRQNILKLRQKPEIATYMVAELTMQNQNILGKTLARNIKPSELYLAHLLGSGNAVKFIRYEQKNPNAVAADIFPKQANANKNLFNYKNGQQKTLKQFFESIEDKFNTKIQTKYENKNTYQQNFIPNYQNEKNNDTNNLYSVSYSKNQKTHEQKIYAKMKNINQEQTQFGLVVKAYLWQKMLENIKPKNKYPNV